jgi:PAS domain S-box-containing protein
MCGGEADHLEKIRNIIIKNPKGLSISDISRKAHLNRNSVSKYLQVLLASGEAEFRTIGAARVYMPSHRLPVSALLEYSGDLIAVLDRDGELIHANVPYIAFCGLQREDVLGVCVRDADLPLLSDPALVSALADPPAEEVVIPEIEWKDGTVFRVKIFPTNFESGGHGTTVVLEDITAEKDAWGVRSLLASIVESTDDAVIGKNLDGAVLSWNRAAEVLYGYTAEEMVGQPLDPLVPPELAEEMAAIMEEVMQGSPVRHLETARIRKDGKRVEVSLTISPIRDESGAVIGASTIARDVTALKRAEAERERHLGNMAFLSETATAIVRMNDEEIYGYIAGKIREIVPGAIVAISSYDPANKTLTAEEVAASPHDLEVMAEHLRTWPIGITVPVRDEYMDDFKETGLAPGPPLYNILMRSVPEEYCRRIEEDLGLNGSLYAPIISADRLLGSVLIIMKRGTAIENRELIETFIDQAAVAIQRRATFLALQRSRKQAKELLDATHDLALLTDAGGRVLDLNEEAVRFFGLPEEDLIGRSLRELLPEEVASRQEAHVGAACTARFEIQVSGMVFDVSIAAVMDECSISPRSAIFLRDITAEREAEDRIRQMNRNFADIIEFLPDPTFIIDADGMVTAWNRAMEGLTGVSKDAMIGKGDYQYAVPFYGEKREILIDLIDAPDWELPPYLRIDRARHAIFGSAYCPSIAGGEGAYLWGKATALFDDAGNRVGAIESIRDVSAIFRAEEALKQSEAKYRDLVENANSVILTLDTEGRITFFNRFAEAFFGYAREEVLGKSVLGLIVPETDSAGHDLRFMIAALCSRPDRFGNVENENFTRDGRIVWISWTNHAIYGENGETVGVTCVGNDISARKRMEEELKAARQNLEATVRRQTADLIFANTSLKREIEVRIGAQEALEKSMENLWLMLEVIADCIFVAGTDGEVWLVRTPGEALRGVSNEAIRAGALSRGLVEAVFALGGPVRQEIRLASFGREIPLDTWLIPVPDWGGKGPAIVGVAKTDGKKEQG